MLVPVTEMLQKARAGKYAVAQININNLEWTKAVLATAQELNSPVILGVSEGAGKYMTGFKTVAAMVKAMVEDMGSTVPVALHLDHGTYEGCLKWLLHDIFAQLVIIQERQRGTTDKRMQKRACIHLLESSRKRIQALSSVILL